MDFLDILDFLVDPVLDLFLCRGKLDIWFKHRFVSFFLGVGSLLFLLILISSISLVSVVGIVFGTIGTVCFVVLDWRYTFWWIREGRFGAELPVADKLKLPKGNLMNSSAEEARFYAKPEENIWEKLGANEK